MQSLHLFFALTLLVSLSGCLEPTSGVFPSPSDVATPVVGTHGPAPDQGVYHCITSTGSSCQSPHSRIWLPGWITTAIAARGNKVAFSAYPTLAKGGANFAEPLHAGQIDLDTGKLDWLFPLGKYHDDYYSTYDMAVAPNGDVIIVGNGYGELLLGDKLGQFDGFVASFDTNGNKRFAYRIEIRDVEPSIADRPRLTAARIFTDDIIRVQTAFQVTDVNQLTIVPIHLFAFTMDGSLKYRQEVPISLGSFNGAAWPVEDGTLWVKTYPGSFRRYSRDAAVLNTFELPQDIDIRGFVATGPTSGMINLTTKGITNELHHFDAEMPLVPIFSEPTFPEFHAAALVPTLGFEKTYFAEMAYTSLSHRFARIDANGNRGPVTTVNNVTHHFELFDNGSAVFMRVNDSGTEFIVQPI